MRWFWIQWAWLKSKIGLSLQKRFFCCLFLFRWLLDFRPKKCSLLSWNKLLNIETYSVIIYVVCRRHLNTICTIVCSTQSYQHFFLYFGLLFSFIYLNCLLNMNIRRNGLITFSIIYRLFILFRRRSTAIG